MAMTVHQLELGKRRDGVPRTAQVFRRGGGEGGATITILPCVRREPIDEASREPSPKPSVLHGSA